MRLYLSSFRLGDRPEKLVALAGANRRALVIANACDYFPEAERRPRVERELRALGNLGFWAEELDLRRYFHPGGAMGIRAGLRSAGLIWARGGNAFLLRRAMRQSGFDALLKDGLARDAFAYGGYSGGIAVLAPTLRGIEHVNDPAVAPEGYLPEPLWDGLGVLPFALVPHWRSAHPSSPGMEKVAESFKAAGTEYRTLADGEALVASDAGIEVVGGGK